MERRSEISPCLALVKSLWSAFHCIAEMGSDSKPAAGKSPVGTGLRGLLPSIAKGFGHVVVLVAVAMGTVAKVKPSLFFKIPHVGFIPWAITGGAMPPMFFSDLWEGENHQQWLKDNDVVVSSGAKSGTTWMLYCTHQIRVKGQEGPKPFVDVSFTTPYPEMLQHPEHTAMRQVDSTTTQIMPLASPWCS